MEISTAAWQGCFGAVGGIGHVRVGGELEVIGDVAWQWTACQGGRRRRAGPGRDAGRSWGWVRLAWIGGHIVSAAGVERLSWVPGGRGGWDAGGLMPCGLIARSRQRIGLPRHAGGRRQWGLPGSVPGQWEPQVAASASGAAAILWAQGRSSSAQDVEAADRRAGASGWPGPVLKTVLRRRQWRGVGDSAGWDGPSRGRVRRVGDGPRPLRRRASPRRRARGRRRFVCRTRVACVLDRPGYSETPGQA